MANCNIVGCSNSVYRLEKWYAQLCEVHGLKFGSCVCRPPFTLFPFPTERKDPEARKRWTKLVNRKTATGANWQPNAKSRICSTHFKDGEPTAAMPDPTEHLGYERAQPKKTRRDPPKERLPYSEVQKQRRPRKRKIEAVETVEIEPATCQEEPDLQIDDGEGLDAAKSKKMNAEKENKDQDTKPVASKKTFLIDHDYTSTCMRSSKTDSCEGCRDAQKQILKLTNVNRKLRKEKMKSNDSKCNASYDITNVVLNSDKRVKNYTGIESKEKLQRLHRYVEPRVRKMRYWTGTKKESSPRSSPRAKLDKTPQKPGPKRSLSSLQEFILVLMKLRLALHVTFLGGLFGVTPSTVSQIFNTWIKFLAEELRPLIFWPDQLSTFLSMPKSLKSKYKHLRCTIDCTEVFIERPRDLRTQARTWSDYKKHNTGKFLVAIAPNGMITFVSKVWGGRTSDVQITKESGFYNLLDPGDIVLADRGFTIKEDLLLRGAKLEIPPSSKGKEQQAPECVAKTKKIANARIHVERAIGRIKWFAILKETLPITLCPLLDDIVIVCAALSNFRNPLVE